jgi:recombination protein RecA
MKAAFSKAVFESELASRFATAFKPREKSPAEVIPTGISEVDALMGGLPRGAITEIFGLTSSGRTTLILSALAEVTTREEVCAWVDTTDTFHPASAATAGASLDQVLWIRCGSKLEHAFKATDLLLQGGGFGFVLLDLGEVPSRDARRIISSWWYRFRRVVENTPTAFVVLAQDSCVRSCASLTLEMKRSAEVWSATVSLSSAPDSADRNQKSTSDKFPTSLIHFSPATPPPGNHLQPTHSNLLTGMHLQLERQKPVYLGERAVRFGARTS